MEEIKFVNTEDLSLRVRTGVSLDELRKYGFRPGAELESIHPYTDLCLDSNWWYIHEFWLDEDGQPTETCEGDITPKVVCWIDTRNNENIIWFDTTPDGTYHIGMDDIMLISKVVYELTQAGLVELVKSK